VQRSANEVRSASDDWTGLFEALEAGAQGCLLKSLNAGEFVKVLSGREQGEVALTQLTMASVLTARSHAGKMGFQVQFVDNLFQIYLAEVSTA
jgi:hypothetical protein